jgi:hypothetical protein
LVTNDALIKGNRMAVRFQFLPESIVDALAIQSTLPLPHRGEVIKALGAIRNELSVNPNGKGKPIAQKPSYRVLRVGPLAAYFRVRDHQADQVVEVVRFRQNRHWVPS